MKLTLSHLHFLGVHEKLLMLQCLEASLLYLIGTEEMSRKCMAFVLSFQLLTISIDRPRILPIHDTMYSMGFLPFYPEDEGGSTPYGGSTLSNH